MLRSVWFVLLPFVCTLADKGPGRDDEEDTTAAIAVTSPTNSNDIHTTTIPANSNDTASPTGSSIYTAVPSITTPAPAIRFSTPSNMTTCTPVTFQWQAFPPSSNVTAIDVRLLITNDGVRQAPPHHSVLTDMPPSRRQLPSTIVSRDLTNRTSLASGAFNWSAVTVPEGWYILEASAADVYRADLASQSAQFYVTAGSNTTCVTPNVSTTAAPTTPSHSGLSPGALAGTVVGTVVGVAALLGAFLLPRLWRKGVPEHPAWKAKTGGLYHVF